MTHSNIYAVMHLIGAYWTVGFNPFWNWYTVLYLNNNRIYGLGAYERLYNSYLPHADPYVKVFLVHKGVRRVKWKSSIKRNTLKPVFNESFEFDVSPVDVKDVSLEVMVMDYDHFTRNHPIGVVLFGMTESVESGISHWEKVFSSPYVSISHWHSILPDYQSSRKRAYTH